MMRYPFPPSWTTPSAVRKIIEGLWPGHQIWQVQGYWDYGSRGTVAALLELVSQVSPAILFDSLGQDDGFRWFRHVASIRSAVQQWDRGGDARLNFNEALGLHQLLLKCPDNAPSTNEPALTFVKDKQLRVSIARDVDSLEALLEQREWKAATVLGGSVVEALLLDALLRPKHKQKALAAEQQHVAAKDAGWKIEPLEKWDLWKLVAVAADLGIIDAAVRSVCDGARGFRNLIHPGKERASQPCDRATALTALAAAQHVMRSLQ